jgi:hypothetical protein
MRASFKYVHKFDRKIDLYDLRIDRSDNVFDRFYIEVDRYLSDGARSKSNTTIR